MRPLKTKSLVQDDLEFKGLAEGIEANIKRLKALKSEATLRFGDRVVMASDYALALEEFHKVLLQPDAPTKAAEFLRENFESFEVYGDKDWGDIFMTAYFEPQVKGSLKPKGEMTQALYALPNDMVIVRMDRFAERFPHWSVFQDMVTEQKSNVPTLRGRLVSKNEAKSNLPLVLPYYDRQEIDELGLLKGQKLEMVYVSPIDSFFLQIQGSARIDLDNGKHFRVGYAGQNGHPYVPIGRYLFDHIPKEKMSLQTIEAHLKSLSPEDQQQVFNKNPSYVFFTKLKGGALTSFGTEAVDGRTVATDRTYFPKGALAYLEFEKPIFTDLKQTEPVRFEKASRLVLDQDTGGAIRGPGRLDLYAGKGEVAKQFAGVVKHRGRLTYFVPKFSWLESLKSGTAAPVAVSN